MLVSFPVRFDLELEKWGVDTEKLKELAITCKIIGWTKDWEKELHQKQDAVAQTMFVNKYNDTMLDLIDEQNITYYVTKDDVLFVWGRKGGWTIYGVCDEEGVPYEPFTLFLAISLIRDKPLANGIYI